MAQSKGVLIEAEIDGVLNQYCENTNLLGLIRTYLGQIEEALPSIYIIPTFFELDTAIGDRISILGKAPPRCHRVCTVALHRGADACRSGRYRAAGHG